LAYRRRAPDLRQFPAGGGRFRSILLLSSRACYPGIYNDVYG
jgi:hypothetical protein